MLGGGFPYAALQDGLRGMGVDVPMPPSPQASRLEALQELWSGAGLEAVETRQITVQRTFADFDEYWTTVLGAPSVGPTLAVLTTEEVAHLKARVQASLPTDETGRITCTGWANAVRGHVPRRGSGSL